MNWRELIKDKRFLAAAAAVGLVGLVVLLRKRSAAGTGDEEPADDGSGTAVKGRFDTSATDMASWVSEYTKSVLDAIRAGQTGGSTTPDLPTPAGPHRAPEPAPKRVPGDYQWKREPAPRRIPLEGLN